MEIDRVDLDFTSDMLYWRLSQKNEAYFFGWKGPDYTSFHRVMVDTLKKMTSCIQQITFC